MPQLNNALFDAEKILEELKKPVRSSKISTLEIVQRKLKANLFGDSKISNELEYFFSKSFKCSILY